jgi:hypothetical protein
MPRGIGRFAVEDRDVVRNWMDGNKNEVIAHFQESPPGRLAEFIHELPPSARWVGTEVCRRLAKDWLEDEVVRKARERKGRRDAQA